MNQELLKVLACPVCESRPPLEEQGQFLICTECRRAFPVAAGIPRLLAEEAIEPESRKEQLIERNES